MSEKFDELVQQSWVGFEERLRARLRSAPGGHLELERTEPGEHDLPLVTLDWDGEVLAADLTGLSAGHDFELLEALGWQPPTRPEQSPFWGIALPRDQAEVLAGMLSAALRHVFGVTDPAFLAGEGQTGEGQDGAQEEDTPGADAAEDETGDEPRPVVIGYPDDPADLARMVEETLAVVHGPDVVRDSDGDFPVAAGVVPLWVRVTEESPIVRIFSYVVRSVRDTRQARIEVGILNRRTPLLKFTLDDGVITATAELLATPFVGPQLLNLLDQVTDLLDDLAPDAALRVGGRLWFDGTQGATPRTSRDDSS